MKKALLFLKHETLELLPPTIYFFVVFHIIQFSRGLMAEGYGIKISSTSLAIIGALVVGKAILIADATPLTNWLSEKRLIYNLIWRTVLYTLIVLLFQILEEGIPLISKYGSVAEAGSQLLEEIKWTRFWATLIIFSIFLVFYNVTHVVVKAIGRDEYLNIFFGRRDI